MELIFSARCKYVRVSLDAASRQLLPALPYLPTSLWVACGIQPIKSIPIHVFWIKWDSSVLYGLFLAMAAILLQWLEYQYKLRLFPAEIYIIVLVVGFTGFGIWLGLSLTKSKPGKPFERNTQVIISLALTAKEVEVLQLLAKGGSNQEIAESLSVSPNTIKTHLIHIYQKLEVSRRTQAIQKARALCIIP